MTPAARTAAMIELAAKIAGGDRPADTVVSGYVRSHRYMGSTDRRAITDGVFALLRHHARLGWWLERTGWPEDAARGRVAAFLRLVEGLPADEVAALFSGEGHGPAALSDAERACLDALPAAIDDAPDMPAAVRLECPDWAADLVDTPDELAALLAPAPTDLRVNERVASRSDVLHRLRSDGIKATATPYSPLGIRLADRVPLAGHKLFKAGAVEVQDEGSQIVALMTDAQPGMQVADFCAGAGGKSLGLPARMAGRGRVVACDISEQRLAQARERMKRARLDNIEPHLLADERDRWVARQKGKFDRVLVDAPCSGTGAWRRNPDARWRGVDLAALTDLQDRILGAASRLVKPGGWLVYATCSLLDAENRQRIDRFLTSHPDFNPLPAENIAPRILDQHLVFEGPWLRLSPLHTFTDGFFLAILERRSDLSNEP
ncbi:MAG: RsmB/NOP family class I SAM-dependent RNA methyltransferase [Rhodospirillaceae bacterium]|nr:RsmB/NOP family class I SAM-dependent RNA methyltransferase [Rhodospirillaceae bacterium]